MEQNVISKAEEEAMAEYEQGNWLKSISLLVVLIKFVDNLGKKSELSMNIGWNKWKLRLKDEAAEIALAILGNEKATNIAKSSAHSLLSLYYSEKPGNEDLSSEHARLAQKLTPKNSEVRHRKNLNSCGIAMMNIGKLDRAEQVLRKVAEENESAEQSDDKTIAKNAEHDRGRNGYNLSKVLVSLGRIEEAGKELIRNVIPRYMEVGAYTDLAAAYHQLSVVYRKQKKLKEALTYEKMSLVLWEEHSDDPTRAPQAKKNIEDIEAEMQQQDGEPEQLKVDEPEKKITARDK